MKLFQIEEPDGSSADPDAPGVAVGIDLSGVYAEVAVAIGGNAVMLADLEGSEHELSVPLPGAATEAWQRLFEGARLRAERALGRPVTHAVLAVGSAPDAALLAASEAAGLVLLHVVARDELDGAVPPVLAAAILAEDLAPRPGTP